MPRRRPGRFNQVRPAELEALLLTHPRLADAAVIGVHDSDGEEVPKAFVVLQPEAELHADAIMSYVARRVAPYKKVRHVQFIDTVPRVGIRKDSVPQSPGHPLMPHSFPPGNR